MKKQAEKKTIANRGAYPKKYLPCIDTDTLPPTKRLKAIIVDDDEDVRELLRQFLVHHGFKVTEAFYSLQAIEKCQEEKPDLVLLDIKLAYGESGFEICRKMRELQNGRKMKIIMLTAVSEPLLMAAGFSCGADGYLTKPFDEVKLMSLINYHLGKHSENGFNQNVPTGQKNNGEKETRIEKFGFSVSLLKQEIWHHDRLISDLSSKEFEILVCLLKHAPSIVSREQILEEVWADATVESKTVDVHICRLREKLGPSARNKIQGVAKLGYKISDK